MFDSLPDEEDADQASNDEKSSWWIGRWAHVIAILSFTVLYFPFAEHFWSWQVAITASYIVFMLCCTCGLAFRDSDDFFGNLQVSRYREVVDQANLYPDSRQRWGVLVALPRACFAGWIAQRGRRLSLWDMFGVVIAYVVAVREAAWMANKIKHHFPELEETF